MADRRGEAVTWLDQSGDAAVDAWPRDSVMAPLPRDPDVAAVELARRYLASRTKEATGSSFPFELKVEAKVSMGGSGRWIISKIPFDSTVCDVVHDEAGGRYHMSVYHRFDAVTVPDGR